MQNQKEIAKINHFLSLVSPVVADVVRTILRSFDWQVMEKGSGLVLAFLIKSGDKEIKITEEFTLNAVFIDNSR